jgi:HK97 family phage portal protein
MINKLLKYIGFKLVRMSSWMSTGWHTLSGTFSNAAKEQVTNETALTVSTVYAAIRNISEDIAKLPLKVYRKEGNRRIEVPDHRLNYVLNYKPNEEMTAMSYRETGNAHAMGWGNHYAEILRNRIGEPSGLVPIKPSRVSVKRESSGIYYDVMTDEGTKRTFSGRDIFHLHGLGFDGLMGYNIIQQMAQSVGGAIATEKMSSAFFGNGMHASGHLEHPNNLSPEAQRRLADQLERIHGGAGNAYKTLVLEEGMKYTKDLVDPKASQMIETRQFTVSEFCRWLRIPPHKVADLSRATFSNIEQQNIDYVIDCLLGWAKRWEQCVFWKLFTDEEKQQGYYVEHEFAALLRGDINTRYDAYSKLWDRGVLSPNEIRAFENMNPIKGGDNHYIPLNYTTIEAGGQLSQNVTTDMTNRIIKSMSDPLYAAIKKHGNDFDYNKFIEQHEDKQRKYIGSMLAQYVR